MYGKYFFFSVFSLLIVFIIGCNRLKFESQWSKNPISVDGNPSDWESKALNELEEMSVSLGLCNDSDYLYLLIRAENPMIAENLRRAGISLTFSNKDVKEQPFGLHYTGSDTLWPDFDPNDSFWETLTPEQRSRYRRRQWELKNRVRVVHGERSLEIAPDGTMGIAADLLSERGILSYEFRIPIQIAENRPYAIDSRLGEMIGIGIKLGKIETEDMQMMDPSGYSERGMMGGGRMRDRGGRGMGMKPGMRSAFKSEMWFDVVLAGES